MDVNLVELAIAHPDTVCSSLGLAVEEKEVVNVSILL